MSGSIKVAWVMRGSRQSMSRTGIPPLPAPTCTRCAMDLPLTISKPYPQPDGSHFPPSGCGYGSKNLSSFRLRQRPFAGFVPDFVTRQPTPRCLDGKDTRKPGWVPPARHPGTSLSPKAQRLAFEQMGAMLERCENPDLGRHRGITRHQPRFQLVNVMSGLQTVTQHQTGT